MQNNNTGTYEVDIDPTRGAILEKLIQKKTFFQRIADGGLVGYVICMILEFMYRLQFGGQESQGVE